MSLFHRHRWEPFGTVRAPGQHVVIERCRCKAERRWGGMVLGDIHVSYEGAVYPHPRLGTVRATYG